MSFDFFLLLYFFFKNGETEKLNFEEKNENSFFVDESDITHTQLEKEKNQIFIFDLIRFFLIMATKKDYDHLFKLVLIGDSSVGKSCLLLRFAVRLDGTCSLAAEK
tara:strand:- start:179 stop:496 length:318 start_codon:yes stop_codon:yes gene_type:complete